jgi:excisionase family DNA binding protein
MSEAEAARARELLEQLQVTPDGWPGMDAAERLRWLVENTAQVLHPRPPTLRFRSRAGEKLRGPFLLEGALAERIEAERAELFERLRHEAAGEVARQLLAADPPPGEEVRREAGALLALLGRAAKARAAGRPRTEPVAHVERLLGSLAARLLRPDAERARRARRCWRRGGRPRTGAGPRRRPPPRGRGRAHRQAPARAAGASDSAVARWVRRGGGTPWASARCAGSSPRCAAGRGRRKLTGRVRRRQPATPDASRPNREAMLMPPETFLPAPPRAPARGGPAAPEPLLTVGDAAELLRVSTRTVRRLVAAGELPALRVGRQVRLAPADLLAYLRRPPLPRA